MRGHFSSSVQSDMNKTKSARTAIQADQNRIAVPSARKPYTARGGACHLKSINPEILEEIAEAVRRGIRVGASVQPEWCCLLGIFGMDKFQERPQIVSMPMRVEKAGELLRVYFYEDRLGVLFEPLRAQIEPLSIGSGYAIFQQTADGFVVRLGNLRQFSGMKTPQPSRPNSVSPCRQRARAIADYLANGACGNAHSVPLLRPR
jgi:hypothetical protein